ncbi:PIG-L deacetylase family protein [Aquicoccus sp.]|uniref:PIG-L deacetylase family protein n=1 Tax=Aquicoccus sp. TaxID=2055851 RepID=UPI003562C5B4
MKFVTLSGIWPTLERAAMRRLWRTVARRAQDRTADLTRRDCLILAPHPDDETLGCGGLVLLKRKAGMPVHVAVVTDGAATGAADAARGMSRDDIVSLRARETVAACSLLGVAWDHIRFLGFPDGALAAHGAALEAEIAALVDELSPSEIFVCASGDGHRDHVALARAVHGLHAEGRLGGATLWEYPVWFWDFGSWRPERSSNKAGFIAGLHKAGRAARRLKAVTVDIGGFEQRKREALDCHRSQIGALGTEPGWSGLPPSFLEHFFRDRELFFEIAGPQDEGTAAP